jgi:hypothetical protein
MPLYLFAVRHFVDCLEDDLGGVELPDDAAANEFALKVMRGLVQKEEDNWNGWTMEVTQGERRVWRFHLWPESRADLFQ